jgi:hypothetical protein
MSVHSTFRLLWEGLDHALFPMPCATTDIGVHVCVCVCLWMRLFKWCVYVNVCLCAYAHTHTCTRSQLLDHDREASLRYVQEIDSLQRKYAEQIMELRTWP